MLVTGAPIVLMGAELVAAAAPVAGIGGAGFSASQYITAAQGFLGTVALRYGPQLAEAVTEGGYTPAYAGASSGAKATGVPQKLAKEAAEAATDAAPTLRDKVRSLVTGDLGESLDDAEYFIHGTTQTSAENFSLDPSRRFFTAVDPKVAQIFAKRTVEKAGGGDPGGVLLLLPRDTVKSLRQNKLFRTKPIDDMPQFNESIFEPGAAETIEREGLLFALPPGFFK